MGIPFFQQQSAAYNAHLKRNLTIFTPDGRRYQIDVKGKTYEAYTEEVQEYLAPFEVEVLLAQRDSLRDALARRYLIQHFDLGGDAHFAGMEMDSVIDELKQRGITLSAIKSAMRGTVTRIAGEIKNAWPIRESGRNLQYTSYDLVFDAIEAKTAAKRKKIWETVAAWAAASSLPGKEGARLATLQDWDETGDGYALRVDLHHYPRPDLDSCRAITLLDAAERNKDMDILRQALAQNGVELGDIAVNTHAAPHNAQPRTATPANEPTPSAQDTTLSTQHSALSTQDSALSTQSSPTLSDTLAAVRIERDRMSRQLELLSVALADSEERQRQARHIESLEKLLSGIADTLDNLAWPNKPSEWTKFSSVEKGRHIMKAFEHTLSTLSQYEKSLQIAKSEMHMLATELREARKSHEQWQKRAEAELRETREARDQWQKRAENIESATREEMQKQHEAAMLAQELDFTRKLSAENTAKLELQKQHDAALLAQERDFARKMTLENANREELLKQHEAALLAQEIDFTRKMQNMQQERMREAQQLRDNHLRQMEELQDDHLKQIQKLRRLMPSEDALHIAEDGSKPLPAAASKLSRYKAESQEIFDSRIGEYLRIAKDQGLGQADEWLLAEAKKLAETRAQQNYLGA